LAEKVISYYSYVGDIVLDSFSGSGTTGFVAKKFDRKFIGIEMNKIYFDNSVKRILGE
jgi:site-specific DNA-methyltransferase (adenine-specific)